MSALSSTAGLAAQTLAQDAHTPSSPRVAPRHTAADSITSLSDLDDVDYDTQSIPSISSSLLPRPPRKRLAPPPDLRFEQSYLASIAAAKGVWWKIVLITVKDQVLLPLVQGMVMRLVVLGWQRWNRGVKFAGRGVGAKVRRWWWWTNNWKLPREAGEGWDVWG